MSIKNVFHKAAGLFVEFEEQPDFSTFEKTVSSKPTSEPSAPNKPVAPASTPAATVRSVKEIVEQTEGPNLDEITVTADQATSALDPTGNVDFGKVYTAAGLTVQPFGAEQALEVIKSLPDTLPLEVKRSTVHTTLSAMGKAMGVNTESVVADASRKMAVLEAYQDTINLQSSKFVDGLEAEIKTHEARIAALNAEIAKAKQRVNIAVQSCQREHDELDEVLEFFTLDTGASKNAPG